MIQDIKIHKILSQTKWTIILDIKIIKNIPVDKRTMYKKKKKTHFPRQKRTHIINKIDPLSKRTIIQDINIIQTLLLTKWTNIRNTTITKTMSITK